MADTIALISSNAAFLTSKRLYEKKCSATDFWMVFLKLYRLFVCLFVVPEDKTRDLNQEEDKKPLPQQNLCNEKGFHGNPEAEEEAERSAAPQELPAFFSLAALAEVAAMENVHR